MPPSKRFRIEISEFAQLERVDITLGDLTVLVGPQASGKSLVLQLLKLAIDARAAVHTLRRHDLLFHGSRGLLERYFGEGMGQTWTRDTTVRWGGHAVSPGEIAKTRQTRLSAEHEMYFILHSSAPHAGPRRWVSTGISATHQRGAICRSPVQ